MKFDLIAEAASGIAFNTLSYFRITISQYWEGQVLVANHRENIQNKEHLRIIFRTIFTITSITTVQRRKDL
jgi:hypothetical protein